MEDTGYGIGMVLGMAVVEQETEEVTYLWLTKESQRLHKFTAVAAAAAAAGVLLTQCVCVCVCVCHLLWCEVFFASLMDNLHSR